MEQQEQYDVPRTSMSRKVQGGPTKANVAANMFRLQIRPRTHKYLEHSSMLPVGHIMQRDTAMLVIFVCGSAQVKVSPYSLAVANLCSFMNAHTHSARAQSEEGPGKPPECCRTQQTIGINGFCTSAAKSLTTR
eukprot:CAMPEP_0115346496 /NCGR_PEP_ID=MMETSP0270-20121206/94376_1 /TAXON_ID=71861 /ORGANISM="Scrippsiella trochoidea, Strain CCMP3099" /LENGTH=133 /DNA_ID=CAMNT_0002768351 /DNA_START=110 /DNA_END=511 /DNA_ORIENTATION=-